jgi:hypothetical protein
LFRSVDRNMRGKCQSKQKKSACLRSPRLLPLAQHHEQYHGVVSEISRCWSARPCRSTRHRESQDFACQQGFALFQYLISDVSDADVARASSCLMRLRGVCRACPDVPGPQLTEGSQRHLLRGHWDATWTSYPSAQPIRRDSNRERVRVRPGESLFPAPRCWGAIRDCHMPADNFIFGAPQRR